MLDFTDDAFEAQLVQPGTYAGQLIDARQVGHEQVFLALTWQLDVPGRDDPAVIEELLCAGFAERRPVTRPKRRLSASASRPSARRTASSPGSTATTR